MNQQEMDRAIAMSSPFAMTAKCTVGKYYDYLNILRNLLSWQVYLETNNAKTKRNEEPWPTSRGSTCAKM